MSITAELAGSHRPPVVPHEHFPGSFYPRASRPGSLAVEANLPSATIEQLQQKGHNVEVMPEWSIGRLCAASREDGVIKAAATPRLMQAYAIGRCSPFLLPGRRLGMLKEHRKRRRIPMVLN